MPRAASAIPRAPRSRPPRTRADGTPSLSPMTAEPDAARAAARRPRWVLLLAVLVLLAWLVVGGLGGTAQGQLSGVQSNDISTFLP